MDIVFSLSPQSPRATRRGEQIRRGGHSRPDIRRDSEAFPKAFGKETAQIPYLGLLPFIDLNIAKNIIKREGRCDEKALPSTPYSPYKWPASLLPKGMKG